MSLADSLVALRMDDIPVGKPLPWPIYGPNQKLLLRSGHVIETQRQLEMLFRNRLYRLASLGTSGSGGAKNVAPLESKAAEESETRNYVFEDLKPKVGDAIQLQVQEERYPVKLMGYAKGTTIMVSSPVVDGGVILLREGQPVVVRSFSGKDAYAFSSSILRVCSAPLPYIHLAYPKAVQSVAVRKTARADVDIIGAVNNVSKPDTGASRAVRICDLSVCGASFTVGEVVGEKGDSLNLAFRIKLDEIDANLSIKVCCTVCSVSSESDIGDAEGRFRYGVRFSDVPTDISLLLQNLIYQKLLDHA